MSGFLSTSKWLKFFQDAGLPANVSANYAVLFTDNRITTDMLLDLTKEYLYDMGIKVMGDVISILRYARTAYTQEAQEKIFHDNTPATAPKASRPVNFLKRKESFDNPRITAKFSRISLEPTNNSALVRGQCDSSDKTVPQQSSQGKRSVFHRLGENSVSSSTDSTKVKTQAHSVFNRLGASSSGGISTQATSSTKNDVNNEDGNGQPRNRIVKSGAPLQYRGVLKTTSFAHIQPKKTITFSTSTPIRESNSNFNEWIKPALQRRVSLSSLQMQSQRRIVPLRSKVTPRINSISSDPSFLFRRSLEEAEAERRQDILGIQRGTRKLTANNVKARLGNQEKTLTVQLPKYFANLRQRTSMANSGSFPVSRTMISDKNAELQRKTRIALVRRASNTVVLKKPQTRSNVFSRLGSS